MHPVRSNNLPHSRVSNGCFFCSFFLFRVIFYIMTKQIGCTVISFWPHMLSSSNHLRMTVKNCHNSFRSKKIFFGLPFAAALNLDAFFFLRCHFYSTILKSFAVFTHTNCSTGSTDGNLKMNDSIWERERERKIPANSTDWNEEGYEIGKSKQNI